VLFQVKIIPLFHWLWKQTCYLHSKGIPVTVAFHRF